MPIPNEYISYTGREQPNLESHDGGLRPVVGAWNIQVMRANRQDPDAGDGVGNTYNHAPNLTWWQGKFYLAYLSNPVSEHTGPGQTFLCTSPDGIAWSKPAVLFPPYPLDLSLDNGPKQELFKEGDCACMHQRMSFFIAPDGRLLALGYYGLAPEVATMPCRGYGMGRVVREIYQDGTFGPIYFILYNRLAGYRRENCIHPYFEEAPDEGFVEACRALLADKLTVLQWWEENRDADPELFSIVGAGEAFNWYPLSDGHIVGLWKKSRVSISEDGGDSWMPVKVSHSLVMSGGKVWGERTKDGRYALVYNPNTDSTHRWPLAVVTGEDGIHFDHMLSINGMVPPQRYFGTWKDAGPQYVRGIEGGALPPDDALYLTYSMNKEDIWVSRIPLPVTGKVEAHGEEDFSDCSLHGYVPGFTVYSGKWASVSLEKYPKADNEENKALCLRSGDSYQNCVVEKVFPESRRLRIECDVAPCQWYHGRLEMDITDGRGACVYRVILDGDGRIKMKHGNGFTSGGTYGQNLLHMVFEIDCYEKTVTYSLNGGEPCTWRFFNNASTVERMVFRTGKKFKGPYLDEEVEEHPPHDLPQSGKPLAQESVYYIDRFATYPMKKERV